ncbi:hypothetical protein B5G28_10225 [Faecalibacterium sp. An77]|uniref:hypothetical protein n=1 Tax=Faecalibacterium sp. An77 TaxID=1965655 RepID=UPI000B38C30F|nr:hypothetical protein [Faecalibacterium sp. An77]OUN37672.1 hypothetical protein B5G28_10225 [Faecalibacterium sp. An77]
MKMKKFVALALAAVMAVSVLAGCGGGGSGGSLSTSEVNSLLHKAGSDITVTAPSDFKSAVKSTAEELVKAGTVKNSALATTKINTKMGEPSFGLMLTSGRFSMAYILSEREIEAGGQASSMAAMLGLSGTNFGNLGWVDTPEGVAAAIVLGIDGGIETYINRFLNVLPGGARVDADYAVSASKMYDSNDVAYWLIGVEVSASWTVA